MKYTKAKILRQLVIFFADDYRRIEHALSVLSHSEKLSVGVNGVDHECVKNKLSNAS
jgi:hypothetical protein